MQSVGRTLTNGAFLFALATWGGMVVFFTFITTPAVFADLDRDTAARLLGDLFPRYFQVQLLCIAIALAVLIGRVLLGAPPRALAIAAIVLLSGALLLALYSNFSLLPQMVAAQARVPSFVTTPKDDPTRLAYGQLHGRAMILNAITALLGGTTLILTAVDPRLLVRRNERQAPQSAVAPVAASSVLPTPGRSKA